MRIDLPTYRLRGICTIRVTAAGDMRIDFHHSSLFGAYREDATVFVRDGRLGILDRERGAFFGHDSTLSLLRECLGFDCHPDDIAQALLLAHPDCADISSLEMSGSDDSWRLTGIWRGRRIEIEGRRGVGPARFAQCMEDETICYTMSYEYDGDAAEGAYPKRITIRRENGPEHLSLAVRGIREESVGDAIFELFDSLGP